MVTRPLTAKQQAFIREYPKDWNATQAAIRAGYAARYANHNLCQIMSPKVTKAIELRKAQLEEKIDVSVDELVKELKGLAITQTQEKPDINVNNGDKLRAIELLGKYKGMFKEVSINLHADIPTDPVMYRQWLRDELTRLEQGDKVLVAYDSATPAIAERY